ncbi:MAG: hypothetical protein M1827_004637 [Pycnora praestabilis]|nr:MAG: hypothetical protein M1827_004637 [Pycnora praestabilis]
MALSIKRKHAEMDEKEEQNGINEHDLSSRTELPAPTTECPYTIEFPSLLKQRKRKSKGGASEEQEYEHSPFSEDLDVNYVIRPHSLWSANKKYRNFVVGEETFGVNDFVFVNHADVPHGTPLPTTEERQFWIARVLEVRAADQQHVYLRVFWVYWPDDLPGGAQDYHGKHELVVSNHMEIIDAMTVAGKADVSHWVEEDDETDQTFTELYWRQTFNYVTQNLSDLRPRCVCKQPYNPDKFLIGCSNKGCKLWLHTDCVLDDVLTRVSERLVGDTNGHDSKTRGKGGRGRKSLQKDPHKSYEGLFEAQISQEDEEGTVDRVIVTDIRTTEEGAPAPSWAEDIICLNCHKEIK